jgi:chromosome segregation ATPase
MAELGYKAKEEKGLFNRDKGFLVFKNASISDITGKTLDYFVKVDKKGKKDDDGAILYLVANNSNGENASTFFDNDEVRRAKGFLNNLQPEVEAANLEIQIRDQEDAVTKAEKKLKDLQDSKADMEKKIKNLQDDIEKNLKAQGETQKEIENQRQVLENLRAKRKTTDNL